ncbi:MAG: bifunctional diaminohydroxyphosphoribosylaminopyrimidine deaminase/5-amino-6-(5-phosphoribosylamino)uracil reductase RibD [Pseudomonadales bacterium]
MLHGSDHLFLQAAIELAERGLYSTTPNPRVGCLIVRGGRVVGRGAHMRAGEGHAEVNALRDAGASARGATAYVSLEPCAFHGRTPPCTEALIDAGIKRVVAAMTDPHERVAGAGFEWLRGAGIDVDVVEVPEAWALNAGYVMRVRHGRPFVRIKVAASADGRTAMASGESQWITGPEARADVQYWRARSCAILTGSGTVLTDDPQLTVRDARYAVDGRLRQPIRVVADSGLRIPADAALLQSDGPILLAHGSGVSPRLAGVEHIACGDRSVDLHGLLRALGGRGCNEVLVEAGPTLVGALLAAGLWDELLLYTAPKLLGSDARPLAQLPLVSMGEAVAATIADVTRVGADVRVRLTPERASQPQEL